MKFPEVKIIENCLACEGQANDIKSIKVELKLTHELVYFDGHFDQMAILPAVAQLYFVKQLASKYLLAVDAVFYAMRQLKFKSPIAPNTTLELMLQYDAKLLKLEFEYKTGETIKSKGVLLFKDRVLT